MVRRLPANRRFHLRGDGVEIILQRFDGRVDRAAIGAIRCQWQPRHNDPRAVYVDLVECPTILPSCYSCVLNLAE